MNIFGKLITVLYLNQVNLSLSKAAALIPLRKIEAANPSSWEFSAFSQNGEDGIIDYLAGIAKEQNRYFIEIGSSNGLQNNTSWLAIARKYSGLMIEGSEKLSRLCKQLIVPLNIGVDCRSMFLTTENIKEILNLALYNEPDVFSIDIDGNDYYIVRALMEYGFRPKICVVEYNSTFGPDKSATIRYEEQFNLYRAHESQLYWGVSISGWRRLFDSFGYKFITVDLNGANAFFINPGYFDKSFTGNLKGIEFREGFFQLNKFKMAWEKRFKLIEDMDYHQIQ